MAEVDELISRVVRIDSSPTEIQRLVRGLFASLGSRFPQSAEPERTEKTTRVEALIQTMSDKPVVLADGEVIPFRALISTLIEDVSPESLRSLTADTFYSVSPFRELGQIPVGEREINTPFPRVTRLHQLLTVIEEASQVRIPLVPERTDSRGHTFWLHADWSWRLVPFIITWYNAGTSASVSGWDAADIVGGLYSQAKTACETIVVTDFATAFIKAAACHYAESTPEVPFKAPEIFSKVCSIGCDNAGNEEDFCRHSTGHNTSGPVEVTHFEPFGFFEGMSSHHVVQIDERNRIGYNHCG
jgi:hypothetical protein